MNGRCISKLNGHKSPINSLIINPLNFLQILTLDNSGIINMFDIMNSKLLRSISISELLDLPALKFSSLCSNVSSATADSYLYCIVNDQHIIRIDLNATLINNNNTSIIKPIIFDVKKV